MEIKEYDVSFLIKRPNLPSRLVVTYLCLSEEHYKRNPMLNREELIKKNSTFLLKDRFGLENKPEVALNLLKIKPAHNRAVGQKGVVKKWRSVR